MARVGQFRLPDSIQPRLPLVGKVARMARAPVTHRIGLSTAPLLWRLATRCHLHDANLSHMAAVMSGVQRSGRWKLIRTLAYREVTIRTYARGGSGPTRPWPRAGSVRAPARLTVSERNSRATVRPKPSACVLADELRDTRNLGPAGPPVGSVASAVQRTAKRIRPRWTQSCTFARGR
jgi:hypothetical protein